MHKNKLEKFAYKLGEWLALVVFTCVGACLTGLAVALTVWVLRVLFRM